VTAHLVTAHVGGVPVEEILPSLITLAGVGLLLARAWVVSHVRRQRNQRRDRSRDGERSHMWSA
jgi:hypothetical protein